MKYFNLKNSTLVYGLVLTFCCLSLPAYGARTTYYITPDYAEVWEAGKCVEIIHHYRINGQKVATRDKDGLKYHYSDHLGSASRLADAEGNQFKALWYTPFGSDAAHTGDTRVPYKYNDREYDDTGMYYYIARYHDPDVGRFMSADTILPNPYDPQQLNRYAYVRNNPVRFIDPDGHVLVAGLLGGGLAIDILVFGGTLGFAGWVGYEANEWVNPTHAGSDHYNWGDPQMWDEQSQSDMGAYRPNAREPTWEEGAQAVINDIDAFIEYHLLKKKKPNNVTVAGGKLYYRGDIRTPEELFKDGVVPLPGDGGKVNVAESEEDAKIFGSAKGSRTFTVVAVTDPNGVIKKGNTSNIDFYKKGGFFPNQVAWVRVATVSQRYDEDRGYYEEVSLGPIIKNESADYWKGKDRN